MRSRVSDKKRNIIVIVSIVICVLIVGFIVWKMNSLTRNTLNNDDIRANVDCISAYSLSDGSQTEQILNSDGLDFSIPGDVISDIDFLKKRVCLVNLKYSFYNNTGKEISDFSMKIIPIKEKNGLIYFYSDLIPETADGDLFTFTQTIIADKKTILDKYFTESLPLSFEAEYKYELSYNMKGQIGRKTLSFTTVKREEE